MNRRRRMRQRRRGCIVCCRILVLLMRRRIISVPILRLFLLLSPIVLVLPIRRTRCRPRVSLCSLMVSVDTVSMSGRRRVLEGGIRREVGRLAEVLEFRRPYLHLGILDLRVRLGLSLR